ncbi:MAG: hypothetical protein QOI54_2472 [Actinomycetota bacterium]|nr:hypothetical protein [Actinomycetota bacterium]
MSPDAVPAGRDSWLLESMAVAVIAADLEGVVTYWNAAAERLYGYSAEEMLGSPAFAAMVRPVDAGQAAALRARLFAGEQIVHEFPVLCRDGRTRRMRVSSSPLRAEGKVVGILGVHMAEAGVEREAQDPLETADLLVGYADTSLARERAAGFAHAYLLGRRFALCRMPIVPSGQDWPPGQGLVCQTCLRAARPGQSLRRDA